MKIYKPMTKFNAWFIVLLFFVMPCVGQNVAINEDGSLPHPNAILDVKSANKGILIPRMSSANRSLMKAPPGMLVYDTTTSSFWYCYEFRDTSSHWLKVATGNNWATSGNNIDGYNFLGTTNNKPLQIRVNNRPAGEIQPSRINTFWGYEAGLRNSTYTGDTTGYGNTATGYRSLYFNSNGYSNTASGIYSLSSNTMGHSNTASGANSLLNNSLGNLNTATGLYALCFNTTGSQNTATGSNSLALNTTGNYNTAFGAGALAYNNTGSYNTAIGFGTYTTRDDFSNTTALGSHAVVNASNKVRIGNSAVTVIEGQVPFTVPSDGRYKFQVKEDVKGLDFILQLRPVTYQFDVKRFNNQYSQVAAGHESNAANYALQTAYDEATSIRRSGFIAQEVEKAAVATGYNFSGIIHPKTAEEHYSLSYESFVVPLVKAVQELSKEQQQLIDAQNKKIEQQDKKLIALQQQLDDIKQLMHGSK
jgi:trimeric autotransporter adhesin